MHWYLSIILTYWNQIYAKINNAMPYDNYAWCVVITYTIEYRYRYDIRWVVYGVWIFNDNIYTVGIDYLVLLLLAH